MPIITKPNSIVKDAVNTFTLDKSALGALSIVSGDAWFSQQANWKKVRVNYFSTVGRQFSTVVFDATKASPTGVFYVSSPVRDNFDVFSVVIEDFNRDMLRIDASLLTKAEFSIDFGPVSLYTRNFSSPNTATANEYLSGSGLGNNISNGVLNLYVPDSGYNGSLYYAITTFPYSFTSGKTYKIRFTFSEAPTANSKIDVTWNAGNDSLFRVFTSQEITQGFFEVTGVTAANTYMNLKCYTTDAGPAAIKISKYEVFEV